MGRMLSGLVMVCVVLALGLSAQAEEKMHEGKVVSATADSLVMTDKDGKNEHKHAAIGATAKVMLDGKAAKLSDLKKGDTVKVMTDTAGKVASVTATRTSN